MTRARGFDVGTFNLVVSRRGDDGEIKTKREINAFIEIPLESRLTFNMLKKAGVNLIEKNNVAYAVGEKAVDFAYTTKMELKRPMKDGCINPQEKNAYSVLTSMIQSLVGEVEEDRTIVYYSVPANAVNKETDADFHQKMLEDIFKKYKVNNKTLQAFPINEALALIYAELGHKNYTGISASWGAGQVNVCYAIFSQPVFTFSSANSGDWIDRMAAKAAGESPTVINREKMKVDLTKAPHGMVERAIHSQYRILIEKTVQNIKRAVTELGNKVKSQEPLDIVVAGGTASPNGFEQIFKEMLVEADVPIPIGDVVKPEDNLYAVARGALIAAENH